MSPAHCSTPLDRPNVGAAASLLWRIAARRPSLVDCVMVAAVLVSAACLTGNVAANGPVDEAFFENRVRPVLAKYCFECHGEKMQESGLRLDLPVGMTTGGDRGPAVIPGDSTHSLLLQVLRPGGEVQMPPDGRMDDNEVADLAEWVDAGAIWPSSSTATGSVRRQGVTAAEREFWSFRPLAVTPPRTVVAAEWPRTEIDRYLLAELESRGLSPASEVERSAWLRRVTLTLTGLLPQVDELDAYLADSSPDAEAAVIERLLGSSAYAEQWGRHWLDLVRYADTSGVASDHPVPQAQWYRDYVIDSFRRDKPYDQFLKEQLAGDILARAAVGDPERYRELVTATGYLAGARRFGFEPNDDQHLTIQDVIDNLGQVVLGLSLGCARCHDHKFEPVSMGDYYGLYGVFDSTAFPYSGAEYIQRPSGFAPLVPPSVAAELRAQHAAQLASLHAEIESLEAAIQQQTAQGEASTASGGESNRAEPVSGVMTIPSSVEARPTIREIEQQLATLREQRTALENTVPFAQAYAVTDGASRSARIQRRGEPGRLGPQVPRRFPEVFGGELLAHDAAGWQTVPLPVPVSLPANAEFVVSADVLHYVASADEHLLAELDQEQTGRSSQTASSGGRPAAARASTLTDPFAGADRPILCAGSADRAGLMTYRQGVYGDPSTFPTQQYALGYFVDVVAVADSTQEADETALNPAQESAPLATADSPIQVTLLGDRSPEQVDRHDGRRWEVGTRFRTHAPVKIVALRLYRSPAETGVQTLSLWDHAGERLASGVTSLGDGSGRLQLAEQLTTTTQALVARVMVNRIWQHHFGTGLVRSESDFGMRGEPPTHPALLDYLAARFIESGWSIKAMHRLVLSTRASRLSSVASAALIAGDPENRWLGRYSRQRLSAEAIRDNWLQLAGKLETGPPPPHPFPPAQSWNFTQHNPFTAVYDHAHRSIYVMQQRIRRHPYFALFDGADPNASTPRRRTTTVPQQALYLLNSPFVRQCSSEFAERVIAAESTITNRANFAWRSALCRPATAAEQAVVSEFLARYSAEIAGDGRSAIEIEREAWAAVLQQLCLQNEFLYRE